MSEKDHSASLAAVDAARSASESDAATARHTKGPWLSFDSGTLVISEGPGDLLIASLEETEVNTIAEREANAHLISAAPEMYELALKVAEHFADTDAPLGAAARAALRKAEGQV